MTDGRDFTSGDRWSLAVVDYGGAEVDDLEEGDHHILRLEVGRVSDDWVGDRANAIRCFNEEVRALGLIEIPLLPPSWEDVSADARLQRRLSTLLREELGENHALSRKVTCAATCGGCDSILCEVDREGWAVVHLNWSGKQSESNRPWVEAYGSWDDVLPSIEEHGSGSH